MNYHCQTLVYIISPFHIHGFLSRYSLNIRELTENNKTFSCECKQRSKSFVYCSVITNETCMHLNLIVNNKIFHFEKARFNGQSFLSHSFPFTAKALAAL